MTPDEQLKLLAEQSGFEVLDETSLSQRLPRYAPAPNDIHQDVREYLSRSYPKGLYSHQARGLQIVLDSQDLCLATSTASGKSLVFMSAAADRLKRDPDARILALYPAKALIQDQLAKWKNILEALSVKCQHIVHRFLCQDIVHSEILGGNGRSP